MQKVKKVFLIISGCVSLGIGILGIVLPLVPTTPLLLLAAACFFRSSDRMYWWLLENKYFGHYIKNYREHRGIPLKAKIVGVTVLWISILYSALFVVPLFFVKVIMIGLAVYFTWFMLSLNTIK
ncbi:YbaN family protein [Halobacillus sp. A5]|uniref:YbaN family protein n=1 Tax=Halobacillus sp. A5 TaxID=2880263 RepID=UPI0020A664D9|nr:YbaN family protein [Halobacillus sp. A5]MCP3028339.1 YbaN family protein [Halobacillus sp. A5]